MNQAAFQWRSGSLKESKSSRTKAKPSPWPSHRNARKAQWQLRGEDVEIRNRYLIQQSKSARWIPENPPCAELMKEISCVYDECRDDGWDGHSGRAVSQANYEAAVRLAKAIPFDVPQPEVTVEPTGVMAFEWYRGSGKVFVISMNQDRKLSYAGLFDGSEVHGTEWLSGDQLPQEILLHIRRLYR